jgi:hypothetical protein
MKNVAYPLFSFFLLLACSDKNSDPQPALENPGSRKFDNCRVVSAARENFKTVYYEYDDQLRLTLTTNEESYKAEYSYSGNQITIKTYSYGDLATTLTITTNDSGLPLQAVKVYANGVLKTTTTLYEYNDKEQLVKTSETREGSVSVNHTIFQWQDGNMVAESEPDGSKMTKYTYSDKENQPVDWFGEIGIDYGLRAIRNKNRVKTITIPNGDVFTHSYSENNDGLITSETIDSPDYHYTQVYTHECK